MAAINDGQDWEYNPGTPPNGQVQWDNQEGTVKTLTYVPNIDCRPENMDYRIDEHTIGIVTSSPEAVASYLDAHETGTIPLPKYYSRFDEFGNDEARYLGPEIERDGEMRQAGIASVPVEAALRCLVGGGRYTTDDYTLHNCLPHPCILTGGDGAVLIAPVFCPVED